MRRLRPGHSLSHERYLAPFIRAFWSPSLLGEPFWFVFYNLGGQTDRQSPGAEMIAGLVREWAPKATSVPRRNTSATWLSVGGPTGLHADPPGAEEACGLDEGAHLSPSGEAQWACQRTQVSQHPHPYPTQAPPIPSPKAGGGGGG